MDRRMSWVLSGALAAALLAGGCGSAQKEATEAAINAAQTAINTIQGEAAKYVPEQLAATNNALQSARNALAKSDYGGALAGAREAANRARELAAATAAKKEEWRKTWASLDEAIPKSLEAAKVKLDAYSRRRPAAMDPAQLDTAEAQYEQLKQKWADAKAEAAQGNLGEAIQKASGLPDQLTQLKEMLGIKP